MPPPAGLPQGFVAAPRVTGANLHSRIIRAAFGLQIGPGWVEVRLAVGEVHPFHASIYMDAGRDSIIGGEAKPFGVVALRSRSISGA
jgi:hypothetical protein